MERILVGLQPELLARIDDFRFEKRLDNRSEAIRLLIASGLDHKAERRQSPPIQPAAESPWPVDTAPRKAQPQPDLETTSSASPPPGSRLDKGYLNRGTHRGGKK